MGLKHHPKVVTSGLVVYYDAANPRSYVGSGLTINNLFSGFGCTLVNGATYSSNNQGYFSFDGTNDYAQLNLPAMTSWSFAFGFIIIQFRLLKNNCYLQMEILLA